MHGIPDLAADGSILNTEEVSVEGSALIPCDVDKGLLVRTDHVPEVYNVLAVVYYCKSVITQILSLPGHFRGPQRLDIHLSTGARLALSVESTTSHLPWCLGVTSLR